ncbi:hypothetical protein ACFHWD_04160 [Clostridium sp. MT-14]|uniref:hypothetical protein n=1 Tax=Clostridium sp. MT-14 TaxID=3348360 RepID=UPI0035F48243
MILTRSKRIINIDDISEELKNEIEKIKLDPNLGQVDFSPEMEKKITEIDEKIKSMINLQDIINEENKYLQMLQEAISLKGDFFIEGKMINIPAIKNDYTITFNYGSLIYVSGIFITMTGWKPEDTWGLQVDKSVILNNIPTKEIGEEHLLRSIKLADINKDIDIVFHNNSGNSRQLLCDLQYIRPKQ